MRGGSETQPRLTMTECSFPPAYGYELMCAVVLSFLLFPDA